MKCQRCMTFTLPYHQIGIHWDFNFPRLFQTVCTGCFCPGWQWCSVYLWRSWRPAGCPCSPIAEGVTRIIIDYYYCTPCNSAVLRSCPLISSSGHPSILAATAPVLFRWSSYTVGMHIPQDQSFQNVSACFGWYIFSRVKLSCKIIVSLNFS